MIPTRFPRIASRRNEAALPRIEGTKPHRRTAPCMQNAQPRRARFPAPTTKRPNDIQNDAAAIHCRGYPSGGSWNDVSTQVIQFAAAKHGRHVHLEGNSLCNPGTGRLESGFKFRRHHNGIGASACSCNRRRWPMAAGSSEL